MAAGKVCPAVRAGNACNQRGCSCVHTVYRCQICQAPFASKEARRQHEQSPAHPSNATYSCALCSVLRMNGVDYGNHVRGRRHTNKLQSSVAHGAQTQARSVKMKIPPNHRSCDVCGTSVPNKMWASHIAGSRHSSNSTGHAMAKSLRKTEVEKGEIQLNCEHVDFGIIDGSTGTVSYPKPVRIVNGGSTMVVFTGAKLSSNTRGNVFHLVDATRSRQLNYSNSTTVTVKLSASKSDRGVFKNRLELYFEVPSQRRRFAITRPVSARVGSSADYEILKSTVPQAQRKRPRKRKVTKYFAGVRPQALAHIEWVNLLEHYEIPTRLYSVLSNPDMGLVEKLNASRSAHSLGKFNARSYREHMQIRIWAEEESAHRELSEFDMADVQFAQAGNNYTLQVPGLAEKRPSVIVGDRFFVTESGFDDKATFEGFVHKVESTTVHLSFHKGFRWSNGQGYDVQFVLNRLCFRRMHQAMNFPLEEGGRITFPSLTRESIPAFRTIMNTNRPYDSKIWNNEPQRRAVASILGMPPGSVPFVVYGPPGTGKTVTIVEAMRQIVARNPDARILACAPSNSAADIIVERLSEHLAVLGDKPLHRLFAPSRSPKWISENVRKFTHINRYGIFECPPRTELEAFRIVVSTCCSGGVPYGIGFEPGHFTHIFIDEAAQATEAEVMIPVKTMLGPRTNVILSGDVKQLGPIVRSPVAIKLGLGISYLERLMSTPLYDENVAQNEMMVKLTKNYRSHLAILSFPNAKFYKNELEACANREITHCISGRWGGLINKEYPLIFHGIRGQDERNETSPSYFNVDEATLVKDYVKSLLDDRSLRLRPEDIGVITPYRAQVKKIRTLTESFARDATVGSVEIFQGQERKVIIMSTVRSSPDMIKFDLRHTLGFVANPRRFNVAVTRAQALLIVIGDPYVLALDPIWKEFINYVYQGGGYTGVPIDWDATEPVDNSVRLDEARRAQSISELEELIRRTSELDLADDDEFEDAGAFREEE